MGLDSWQSAALILTALFAIGALVMAWLVEFAPLMREGPRGLEPDDAPPSDRGGRVNLEHHGA